MIANLFDSTTIPVLQEVVNFSQARHTVLAGNIANMDTPGYKVRDLSVEDFQSRLQQAIEERHQPPQSSQPLSPGEIGLSNVRTAGRGRQKFKNHSASRSKQRGHRASSHRNGQKPDAAQHGAVAYGQAISLVGNRNLGKSVDNIEKTNQAVL